MEVEVIKGLDKRLYELVAPLVMDANVLKQNRNYPFKTSRNFIWFIAINEESKVLGFLPVELKNKQAIINNYYTEDENTEILSLLIQDAINALAKEYLLTSVTQIQHQSTFKQSGFTVEREWKNYVKMTKKK